MSIFKLYICKYVIILHSYDEYSLTDHISSYLVFVMYFYYQLFYDVILLCTFYMYFFLSFDESSVTQPISSYCLTETEPNTLESISSSLSTLSCTTSATVSHIANTRSSATTSSVEHAVTSSVKPATSSLEHVKMSSGKSFNKPLFSQDQSASTVDAAEEKMQGVEAMMCEMFDRLLPLVLLYVLCNWILMFHALARLLCSVV